MRLTLRPTAMLALGALTVGSIGLVSAAAIPAAADDGDGTECVPGITTLSSVDFEDDSMGDWTQNGDPVLNIVDLDTKVLEVSERTEDYEGISLASADAGFEPGVEYTFSARARLADGEDPRQVRFVATDDSSTWDWTGASSITSDEWTEFSGTYTFPAGDIGSWKVFLSTTDLDGLEDGEVDNHAFYVDDLEVTFNETCDGGGEGPGVCEPETVEHTSIDFEDGSYAPWFAASPDTLEVIDGVLHIDGAVESHDSFQSPTGVFEEGVPYTLSFDVRISEAAQIRAIANEPGASNEWQWVGNTDVPANEWTEISGTYTFGEGAPDARFYLQVEDGVVVDYEVDNLVITYLEPCGDGPEPGSVAISTDFEEGLDGWHLRDSGWDEEDEGGPLPGTPSVDVSTDYAVSGEYSAKVTDRNSQGDGIRFEITDELHPLTQYDITAQARFAEGEPADDLWFSMQVGESTFTTQAQFTNVTNSGWTEIAGTFTMPSLADGEQAWIYFETAWDGGAKANTSTFYIDDIQVSVQEPPVLQDLPPLHSAMDIPIGVAVDNRDTTGVAAEFVLSHFNQITAENFMKPEAWYNSAGEWAPNSGQIDPLMDFAKENDIRVFGHVLVWHSQTPDSFFQDDNGAFLTNSAADQAILLERMETHIHNVAEYLSQWGEFGGDNPLVAWDVVNEVIDDSSNYADGMRRSHWYNILGEEFVDHAFHYADDAFNNVYAADSADRPVVLFINDYNTEFDGKRGRYLNLVDRLLDRGAPIDGIGHQFHLNLSVPVGNLEQAIVDSQGRGLIQAVTELDIETGTPESEAKFVEQGYFYRDAFETFRDYEDELFSVSVWGPIDARSWRDSRGGPLVFDDDYSPKPAYYGIMNGRGGVDLLPPRILTANAFAGSVSADAEGVESDVWDRLPLLPMDGVAEFQLRWAQDHLTVYVEVDDSTATGDDGLTFVLDGETYALDRDGSGDVVGHVTETDNGYAAVAHLPLAASEGDTIEFDVRVGDAGWNTAGATGTVSLVEELSYTEIPRTDAAPTIDGDRDAMWDDATVVSTLKEVEGSGGAIGEFHTLWKDHMLYIYAEIEDDTIDVTGSDPWTQDSVEIYVDGGNHKNGSYRYDDTQIRVSADNAVSVGAGDEGYQLARVESATSEIDGGWAVEVAISLIESGGVDTFQGVDFQVNDAANGSRQAIRNWADPSGVGYQSTARWGVAKLVETVATDPGDGEPGDGGETPPGDGDEGEGPGDGPGADVITPLPEDELHNEDKGGIEVPDAARAGDTITIHVGTEHSGVATQTFLYSEPQLIGQSIVDADGNIRVTIPADTPPGTHTIAVYDADGNLLGWDTIEILAADGSLPVTGAEGFILPLSIGLLLVLLGVGLVVRRQFAENRD